MKDSQFFVGGLFIGAFIAALATGTEAVIQCFLPFLGIGISIGLCLGMGMLIAPKETESIVKDSVEYWKERWADED